MMLQLMKDMFKCKEDIVAQFCTCIYKPSLYVCIRSTELTKPVYIGTRTLELLACMVLHVVRTLTSSRVL